MDHRVKFDFTVHFTNGGSLSANDFRLDIPGGTISDEALAAYLISDMRLLMAGKVEIRNKEILAEKHKRLPIATRGLPVSTIDLAASRVSVAELCELANLGPIRVIGDDGENYRIERLVA